MKEILGALSNTRERREVKLPHFGARPNLVVMMVPTMVIYDDDDDEQRK